MRKSTPSRVKMSMANICHGWDGVGVGVRGATAFWAWNQVQVSPQWTASSMALFMPGQKINLHMSSWALVIPWWNWWSCCSTLSLSKGVTMRASPWKTRPSSKVRVSQCCQYGCKGWGTAFMSSGNQWWSCQWGHASQDHSQRLVGMLPSTVGTGEHGERECQVGCQGQDVDWNKRVYQAGPSPYWGGNRWCNHSPGGRVACTVARLACLPGSSGRWIPGVCGVTQW